VRDPAAAVTAGVDVRAALDRLAPQERVAVVLRHVEDLTHDGKVVGDLSSRTVPADAAVVDLPADGTGPYTYAASTWLDACSGHESDADQLPRDDVHDPLPPGQYELWAVMPIGGDLQGHPEVTAAGGPWALTID
jgi:hypothetical protein